MADKKEFCLSDHLNAMAATWGTRIVEDMDDLPGAERIGVMVVLYDPQKVAVGLGVRQNMSPATVSLVARAVAQIADVIGANEQKEDN